MCVCVAVCMEHGVQPKVSFSNWIIIRRWHKDITEKIVTHTRQKFVPHLIQEIENAMKEKIEVLNILMLSVHNQKQIVQRISLN